MPCRSVLNPFLGASLLCTLSSLLLCRSRQEGSQGPGPEAWTALGDIGAHSGGLGFWDGWNRLDVEPSRIIVLPGPLIGPGMPPRRGEFFRTLFIRIPSSSFLRSKPRALFVFMRPDRPHPLTSGGCRTPEP